MITNFNPFYVSDWIQTCIDIPYSLTILFSVWQKYNKKYGVKNDVYGLKRSELGMNSRTFNKALEVLVERDMIQIIKKPSGPTGEYLINIVTDSFKEYYGDRLKSKRKKKKRHIDDKKKSEMIVVSQETVDI